MMMRLDGRGAAPRGAESKDTCPPGGAATLRPERRRLALAWLLGSGLGLGSSACGGGSAEEGSGTESADASGPEGGEEAESSAETTGDSTGDSTGDTTATTGDGDGDGDGDGPSSCQASVGPVDTSSPDHVVGDGSAASCTAQALADAVAQGGIITFDCGGPVSITIPQQIELRIDTDTTIDGGGVVTLDGGGDSRIFYYNSPNFRATETLVTLQGLRLINARAPASDFLDDPGTGCAWGYKNGEGGALYMRDGRLRVFDSEFENNHAADTGPDTGGGAIYAVGALEVTIVRSRFDSNTGSNAGALGMLFATPTIVDSVFQGNRALGTGANYVQNGCPDFNHPGQGGAGGNGGAIAMDGGAENNELYVCGTRFSDNEANEFGGAVFRTANITREDVTFIESTIDGNSAGGGGGLYISNAYLTLDRSTVSNNLTPGLGGGVRTELDTELNFLNSTFYANRSSAGLAGGLSHGSGGGSIVNCTFAGNLADGGVGLFNAAMRGSSATVRNTIFVDNLGLDIGAPMACSSEPNPGSDNVQWPRYKSDGSTEDAPCVTGIEWADAEVGELVDNGGPTRTVQPSAAVVMGAGADCPPVDQRGEARPAQGCTLGAVEVP